MTSSDSTTPHLIEDVTARINRLLHQEVQDELEGKDGGKEPGSNGGEPRVILHERAGPPSSTLAATQGHATEAISTSQRWEMLRRDWSRLSVSRTRQAQSQLKLNEEATQRAKTREDLAKTRLALAQQWEEVGELRPGTQRRSEGLAEDQAVLEDENRKVAEHGAKLESMERFAEEDKVALEEEQVALARAWVELGQAKERVAGIFSSGGHRI